MSLSDIRLDLFHRLVFFLDFLDADRLAMLCHIVFFRAIAKAHARGTCVLKNRWGGFLRFFQHHTFLMVSGVSYLGDKLIRSLLRRYSHPEEDTVIRAPKRVKGI